MHLKVKGENICTRLYLMEGKRTKNIMEDVSRVFIALKYETLEHLQWPVELLISKYFIYYILNIKKLVNNNVMS